MPKPSYLTSKKIVGGWVSARNEKEAIGGNHRNTRVDYSKKTLHRFFAEELVSLRGDWNYARHEKGILNWGGY